MTDDKRPTSRKYARIYYDEFLRDYADVFFDPTGFSTYVRLLVGSEKAYPADAILPAAVRRADLELLKRRGLVELVNGHGQYRIRGFLEERRRRAEHGKKGADGRW